eukprot:CAMPEP_0113711482 /NCGR_PEP_ID=MMETSP0038_2-20120614/30788_1 /TAXON_ID=2898 /ORGANISM="Cryptomonas paramecium" /LENGTH=55 /DNA_ID=CAMNT_0000637757 /DNA_START=107 /DNA_END=270 /DNA_ORIENTATION=- /assembly_acc=CAM_ASM_000170
MTEVESVLQKKGYQPGDRVLLYDGICNLCNGWVRFLARRSKEDAFKFAALQGEAG